MSRSLPQYGRPFKPAEVPRNLSRMSFLSATMLTSLSSSVATAQPSAPPPSLPSFGPLLLQVSVSLLLVCALAYLLIRFGLTKLQSRRDPDAQMEIVERLSLDARRSIIMLRVREKLLVVGVSETGFSLLTELEPESDQSDTTLSESPADDGANAETPSLSSQASSKQHQR